MKTIRYALFTATFILLAHTAMAAKSNFEVLKSSYTNRLAKIEEEPHAALSKLLAAYGRSLDKAIEALRAQGDPERVMAALAEKARFATAHTVPNPSDDKLPQLLQDVQIKYHADVASVGTDRDKRQVPLIDMYIGALDKLMRKYTGDGKIDLAMEVKKEKERIEFELAEILLRLKSRPGENPEDKPEVEVDVRTIRFGSIIMHRWARQFMRISKGSKVTIVAKPERDGLKKTSYSHDSLRVRLGEGANVNVFDTNGKRNWSTKSRRGRVWHYKPSSCLVASEDCYLYFWGQGKSFSITVTVETPIEK